MAVLLQSKYRQVKPEALLLRAAQKGFAASLSEQKQPKQQKQRQVQPGRTQ
jgi:hypothetical protein